MILVFDLNQTQDIGYSFSHYGHPCPDEEDVCECSGNTINSVNVKGYFQVRANLRINRDEISDEMDRIVELLTVRTECRYGYTHKKMKLILCVPRMQIALVSIQRKIKFNVGPCDFAPTHFNLVPSFPGYEIAELLIFI